MASDEKDEETLEMLYDEAPDLENLSNQLKYL